MNGLAFIDSNILLYGLHQGQDAGKSELASQVVLQDTIISTQVISEVLYVSQRKFKVGDQACNRILATLSGRFEVVPMTLSVLKKALQIRQVYKYTQYDAQIIAAALEAGCDRLYTEDMQHGQLIEGRLTLINPFVKPIWLV